MKSGQTISKDRLFQEYFWPMILLIGVVFAISMNFRLTLCHELWRDEAQSWLIARDTTLRSLWEVLSWEGHPCLWYLILMPLAKLGFPYVGIKWISCAIMTAVILLIAWKSPFSVPGKLGAIYSCCIYWYASFARSYALGALLIILLAVFYKDREKRPVLYCLLIALMLQVHVLLAGFAFMLSALFSFERLFGWLKLRKAEKCSFGILVRRLTPLLLPLLSALLLLLEFKGISDSSFSRVVIPRLNADLVLRMWESFKLSLIFQISRGWELIPILLLYPLIHALVLRNYAMMKTQGILIGTIIFLSLMFAFYVYPLRYRAIFLTYFIIWGLWVFTEENRKSPKEAFYRKIASVITSLMLVAMGFLCFSQQWESMRSDLSENYSDAEYTADFINSLPEDAIVVESSEDFCNSVIPYLKNRVIYNPFGMEAASYMKWDINKLHEVDWITYLGMCRRMFPDAESIYILYCHDGNKVTDIPLDQLEEVYRTGEICMIGENYSVYTVDFNDYGEDDQ